MNPGDSVHGVPCADQPIALDDPPKSASMIVIASSAVARVSTSGV